VSLKQTRLVPSTEHAAFLLSLGFPVKGTHQSPRGVLFIFDDDPRVESALLEFTNGRAHVEPRAFLRALNDLRDLARSREGLRLRR